MTERKQSRVERWIVDTVVVFCLAWFGFWIELATGTITMTAFHFNTTEVLGVTLLWTPGTFFVSVVLIAYMIGYRDVLALNGDQHGI